MTGWTHMPTISLTPLSTSETNIELGFQIGLTGDSRSAVTSERGLLHTPERTSLWSAVTVHRLNADARVHASPLGCWLGQTSQMLTDRQSVVGAGVGQTEWLTVYVAGTCVHCWLYTVFAHYETEIELPTSLCLTQAISMWYFFHYPFGLCHFHVTSNCEISTASCSFWFSCSFRWYPFF